MKNFTMIFQIILSICLISSILLQAKGTGLGQSFGGANEQYRSKRGIEKLLHRGTIVLTVLFLISSLINFIIK